ncbi:MAG: replicative DNA helicase [Proteobacteria bacterium]|nr:replicative DNA helicase [Pseudomonadota bacterium]
MAGAEAFGLSDPSDHSGLRGRVPPHDLEAERAVLSAVLLDNSAVHEIASRLVPDDFYHPAHQVLYQAILALDHDNRPVDLITLSEHLTSHKLLDRVGGPIALAEIADFEATAANVVHYAGIVRDKSVKRSLIQVATEIVAMGYEETASSNELLDSAESRIFSLGEEKAQTTLRPLHEEMHDAVDHVEALMARGGDLTGLATGFKNFDELTGGLQPGDLIILAARPAMGKTALALNIARNVAVDLRKNVAVFSLEMTTRALVLRMLSSEAQVDFAAFRKGLISVDAHDSLVRAAGELAEANIWIDDSGASTVMEMRAKCRRLRAKRGLDLVIVDYLQLAHGDKRTDSREQEISEISRGLKALAKELGLPVIAISQLNRGPEMRKAEDKRPMLADLRESGAIEQDADVIGFIYRDVLYNRDTEYEDLAELIVAKQRNGPVDTVRLKFEGRYARFRDWTQDDFGGPGGRGGGFTGPPGGESDVPF